MNNPDAFPSSGGQSSYQTIKQECLVSALEAADDGVEWAVEFLKQDLRGHNPDSQQAFLHCGRCACTVALEKEDGSIRVWPPGCELGNTIT